MTPDEATRQAVLAGLKAVFGDADLDDDDARVFAKALRLSGYRVTTDHPDVRAGLDALERLVKASAAIAMGAPGSAQELMSATLSGRMALDKARAALSATSEPT